MKQLQLQEWKLQAALCLLQLYLDHKPAEEKESFDFGVVLWFGIVILFTVTSGCI